MRFVTLVLALSLASSASQSADARSTDSLAAAQKDLFGKLPDSAGISVSTYMLTAVAPLGSSADASTGGDSRALEHRDAAGEARISLAALDGRAQAKHVLREPAADLRTVPDGTAEREPFDSAWLMGLVTIALIGYQLRRKHRLLRPQRFTF